MTDNRKQVEKWLEDHGAALFRYAISLVRDQSVAEDLVQETFIVALNSADRFQGRSNPRTWLSGILRHKALDHHRRSFRDAQDESLDGQEGIWDTLFDEAGHWKGPLKKWPDNPHDVLVSNEFSTILNRCLAALDGRKRAALLLRAAGDLSTEAICKELGVTATNLWVLAHRGRESLRRCLDKQWFGKI